MERRDQLRDLAALTLGTIGFFMSVVLSKRFLDGKYASAFLTFVLVVWHRCLLSLHELVSDSHCSFCANECCDARDSDYVDVCHRLEISGVSDGDQVEG